MASKPLKLTGATVEHPGSAAHAAAAGSTAAQTSAAAQPLQLALAVENPGDQPLHVWASWRSYDYDAGTHTLTVYLTDHLPTPPGITMISNHPRDPAQVVVAPKGKLKVKVAVPASIRRRVASSGMGMAFVEEPIGQVDHVDFHVQYGTAAFTAQPHDTPQQHRSRLLAHGEVVRATLTPTAAKE